MPYIDKVYNENLNMLLWDMIDDRRLNPKEIDYEEISKELGKIMVQIEQLAEDVETKRYMI